MIPVTVCLLQSFRLVEMGRFKFEEDPATLLFGSQQTRCYISSKTSFGLGVEQIKCLNYIIHLLDVDGRRIDFGEFYHAFTFKTTIRQRTNDLMSSYSIDRDDGGRIWEWRDAGNVCWSSGKKLECLVPQFVA